MLEYTQLLAYVTALGIAAAVPGPGMTALVARSVSSGAKPGFAMLIGLIFGDLFYLSFAVFGLSMIAQSFNLLFVIIKWGAVLYLCYLAWCFWKAEHYDLDTSAPLTRSDLLSAAASGFSITMGNPKTIAFYLALLPVVINLENVTLYTWAAGLVPATILVLLIVGAVFIFSAISIRHALSSVKAQKILHRGAASAMLAAAGTMVIRET